MSLRDRLGNVKFSRPMLIAVGSVLGLLILVVVLALVVLPRLGRKQGPAEVSPTAAPTLAVVAEGSPSPTAEAKAEPSPTPMAGETTAPAPTTRPPVQATATPAPTLIQPSPAGTAVAGGPTATPLPAGGGEGELPHASGSVPWLIPLGVVVLIIVGWWRWRRHMRAPSS